MPCISGFWADEGLIIEIGVMPHGEAPKSPLKLFRGLIDTGASRTCISQRLVSMYNFAPTGDATMAHAWGTNKASTYLFNVYVPTAVTESGSEVTSEITRFTLEGLSFKASGDFDLLIGRDFIGRGQLTMNFDGHFTMCF